jgi:hypothetical protein
MVNVTTIFSFYIVPFIRFTLEDLFADLFGLVSITQSLPNSAISTLMHRECVVADFPINPLKDLFIEHFVKTPSPHQSCVLV